MVKNAKTINYIHCPQVNMLAVIIFAMHMGHRTLAMSMYIMYIAFTHMFADNMRIMNDMYMSTINAMLPWMLITVILGAMLVLLMKPPKE